MKNIVCFLVLLVLFIGTNYGEHTLQEAKNMVDWKVVHTDTLVVKFNDSLELTFNKNTLVSNSFRFQISSTVSSSLSRLFMRSVSDYKKERQRLDNRGQKIPHLENYYLINFAQELSAKEAKQILQQLYQTEEVSFAYFEPKTEEAVVKELMEPQLRMVISEAETPNFEHLQFYLEPAPRGVDATFAWQFTGGHGEGVKVIDVEHGWYKEHEDLQQPFWHNDFNWERDHGTAVWGEVAAKRDGKGVTGIAYKVQFGRAGTTWKTSARVYELAAAQLSPGDILILEQHQPGPDNGKYTAMEYWQANFDAIKSITSRGIFVIAAAGNGNSNFDNPVYGGAFDLKVRDSGAILVGAGGPPTKSSHLQRLGFSNYGSRIDAFGYGRDVTTTAYGDLFNATQSRKYTKSFSGTSSATPIVSGAVACISGIAKAKSRILSPLEIRNALRQTGTKQEGKTNERIGNLPNLKELIQKFALDK